MPDYLQALNPPQREAVLHTEGPLLVLAGAGSGKTRVITRRIAHVLAEELAAPEQVLAVTFTNKAATEMRTRTADLTGEAAAKRIGMMTYHAYGLQVLRRFAEQSGLRRNFTIAGESDARTLLRRVVDDVNSKSMGFSPAQFQSMISLAKNQCVSAEKAGDVPVRNATEEKYNTRLGEVYARYDSALRAANAVDFDDLLVLTQRLWQNHPDVLEACRGELRYVLVDEYQDTNQLQFELLRLLVAKHRNLCVVGDDDQAIYAWRGASSRNILEFEKFFPGAKVVTLDQNYRSTSTILQAANAVIANNIERREKKLWSDLGKGREIDLITVADEEAEAKEALHWLQYIQEKSGARYRDFAILYRSNLQSRPIEIAFRQAGIPYTVYGGQDFFERAEVKDVISYLKVIANPRDESALLRIINMPRRGIGDVTLHRAHEICDREKCGIVDALQRLPVSAASQTHQAGIKEFVALLNAFRRKFRDKSAPLAQLAEELMNSVGYRNELDRLARTPMQASSRWENVSSVFEAIDAYQTGLEQPSLSDFLDKSHLNDSATFGKAERRAEGVSLMTIHSAKGLEFPFVFLMGCEEGLLPHANALREGSLDEERRLFYVALTRGQRHVTLFETLIREKNGRAKEAHPSRFLREIPQELIRHRAHAVRMQAPPEPAAEKPKPVRKKRVRQAK